MPWTLCTKQDVKALHNIDVASLEDSWSTMAEGLIAEYVGSPALSQDTTYIETFNGDSTNIIRVGRPPIKSVTSIKFSGTSIPASDYEVGTTVITLLYYTLPSGIKNIEVEYVSGYPGSIPESVRLAAIAMIAAMSNHYKRFGSDGSLKWADVQEATTSSTPTKSAGLISHLFDIMRTTIRRNKIRIG